VWVEGSQVSVVNTYMDAVSNAKLVAELHSAVINRIVYYILLEDYLPAKNMFQCQ